MEACFDESVCCTICTNLCETLDLLCGPLSIAMFFVCVELSSKLANWGVPGRSVRTLF